MFEVYVNKTTTKNEKSVIAISKGNFEIKDQKKTQTKKKNE